MYSSMFTTTFLGMCICIQSKISAHLKKNAISNTMVILISLVHWWVISSWILLPSSLEGFKDHVHTCEYLLDLGTPEKKRVDK